MSDTHPVIHKDPETASQRVILNDILTHIATVTHVLLVGLTAFVIWLCFKEPFTLLTWHVFLYTIGWILLMLEAIIFVSKDNIVTKYLNHSLRVRWHWLGQILAVGFCVGGFIVIYLNKTTHFTSDHGITGLTASILAIPTCLNGFMALYSVDLKNFIRPNLNKLFHSVCGIGTIVIGSYSLITGYYTKWFQKRVDNSDTTIIICFVITILVTFWALVKPMLTSVTRIKTVFS